MSRVYTVTNSITLTAAGTDSDILTVKPAANKPIRLRGLKLSQTTEVADAGEEGIAISILQLAAVITDGTGGAAITPLAVDENDASPGFTARENDTTLTTTSGASNIKENFGWINRNTPLEMWWPEDKYAPRAQNAGALVIRSLTTLVDDMTLQYTAYIEEY